MTFQQNRITYAKKCEKIALKMIDLGLTFRLLSKSIMQHGITEDIRQFIEDKEEQFKGLK